jgi:hypothetical protein
MNGGFILPAVEKFHLFVLTGCIKEFELNVSQTNGSIALWLPAGSGIVIFITYTENVLKSKMVLV